MVYLCFGEYFNHTIDLSPKLTHLRFGYKFNCPIELSSQLIHLKFGKYFNCNVNLPNTLKYLKFDCANSNIINYLPNNVEELELRLNFNLELNDLPEFY